MELFSAAKLKYDAKMTIQAISQQCLNILTVNFVFVFVSSL